MSVYGYPQLSYANFSPYGQQQFGFPQYSQFGGFGSPFGGGFPQQFGGFGGGFGQQFGGFPQLGQFNPYQPAGGFFPVSPGLSFPFDVDPSLFATTAASSQNINQLLFASGGVPTPINITPYLPTVNTGFYGVPNIFFGPQNPYVPPGFGQFFPPGFIG